jgi:hypothetical protein
MMKFKKLLPSLLLLLAIVLASCRANNNPTRFPQLEPAKDLASARDKVATAETGVLDSATKINERTVAIRQIINRIEKDMPKWSSGVKDIRTSTTEIDNQTMELRRYAGLMEQAKAALEIADVKLGQYEHRIDILTGERDKAVSDKEQVIKDNSASAQRTMRWLYIICILGAGAGVALIVSGNTKMGTIVVIGAVASLVLAIVINKYIDYIAFAGMAALTVCFGFLVWQLFIRKKALKEVVQTAEIAKQRLDPADRIDVFGHDQEPGVAFAVQSKQTEDLVAKIREELKKDWEHVVKDSSSQIMDAYVKAQSLAASALKQEESPSSATATVTVARKKRR